MPTSTKLLAGAAALILTAGLFRLGYVLWLELDVLINSAAVKILASVATLVFVAVAALRDREWINRRQ